MLHWKSSIQISKGNTSPLQMSSTGENGDPIPGKQNEEKTYKKVSFSLSSESRSNLLLFARLLLGLFFLQSHYCYFLLLLYQIKQKLGGLTDKMCHCIVVKVRCLMGVAGVHRAAFPSRAGRGQSSPRCVQLLDVPLITSSISMLAVAGGVFIGLYHPTTAQNSESHSALSDNAKEFISKLVEQQP